MTAPAVRRGDLPRPSAPGDDGDVALPPQPTAESLPSQRLARIVAAQRDIALAAPVPDALFRLACDRVMTVVDADGACISTLEGDFLVCRATTGTTVPPVGQPLPMARSIGGLALATGTPVTCHDALNDDRSDPSVNAAYGIRASLTVPLLHEGRPVAVVYAFSATPHGFTDADRLALSLVSDVLAARLAHAIDLEAREETASALTMSDRHLRAAQELTGLGTWQASRGRGVRLSTGAARMFGLDPRTVHTTSEILGLLEEADRTSLASALRGDATGSVVVRAHRRDTDELRWLQAWGANVPDEDGDIASWGALLDVTERERSTAHSQLSDRRLAAASSLAGLATWSFNFADQTSVWSDELFAMFGMAPGALPNEDEMRTCTHPEDRAALDETVAAVLATRRAAQVLLRVVGHDGVQRWHRAWIDATEDDDGSLVGLWGVTQEVTEREAAAAALRSSETQFRVAFDNAPTGMTLIELDVDDPLGTLRANTAFLRMLGYDGADDSPSRLDVVAITHPDDVAADMARMEALIRGDIDRACFAKRFLHRDGHVVHSDLTLAVAGKEGDRRWLMGHALDLTERRVAQAQLERLAHSDTLTGLANRTKFNARLAEALAGREAGHGRVGLLLFDLDRFKLVNDTLGHAAGDLVLVEVARRISNVLRDGSLLARLGGDEFVVMLEGLADSRETRLVALRVLETLRAPYRLPTGETIVPTASVGVAITGDGESSADEIYREADLALYRAKDAGRDRYAVFDAELRARAVARLDAEHLLRDAMSHGRLHVLYQPVVELATCRILGAEALVRVVAGDGRLLTPDVFIDVAEDTGLIVGVDGTVLEIATDQLAAWTRDGLDLEVAVNVSPRTLEQPHFARILRAALHRHQQPGSSLVVELTERSLLVSSATMRASLSSIRRSGARLSVDDFGTGYSALAYLGRFDLDSLKIDRSFVSRLGTGDQADAVVAAVIALAHAHRLTVVAEGVETIEQAQILTTMGCDRAQGWLFGRPLEAEHLAELARRHVKNVLQNRAS